MHKLDGITRNPGSLEISDPVDHSPLRMANRIKMRLVGPDGEVKQEVDKVENLMVTYGLNNLCERVATGGEASDWVAAYAIGTHTTAVGFSNNALGASTANVALSNASMAVSDLGDRTVRYTATFASNNPAGAATIEEVGIFGHTDATNQMIAHSLLGTDVVSKGASDQIQISHDIIFTSL